MLSKKAKEVLLVLQKAGVLQDLVLIGSWCGHFYISYFKKNIFNPSIQTLDIDFLIPNPGKLGHQDRSIPDLLASLDFDAELTGSGWVRFVHPELRVEFLVPRLGPSSDEPRSIPQLHVKAMPLRHTHVLTEHMIKIQTSGLQINVPHPGAFSLHKLFVSGRRKEKGKAIRDRELAFRLLEAIRVSHMEKELTKIWNSFTKKEQAEIRQILESKNPEEFGWLDEILTCPSS